MTFEPAHQIAPGVFLVDTGYQRPHLAACYVVRGRESAAIVETGSFQTVPRLLAALAQLGIAREAVSHVIVTHVHLDHAGGAGALMRELPKATLVAHPRGARHLIDPAKLWAGTVAVYGEAETLAMYGAPVPVPAARVVEAPDGFTLDLGARTLRFLDAPGHAKHHFVVLDEATRGFFSGDSFGLSYRETDGGPNGPFFFISTTPVQFDPAALHATLDRMLAERPERLYLTHYGLVEGNLATHGAALHRGIDAHVAAARAAPAGPGRHAAIKAALTAQLLDGLTRHGSPLAPGRALEVFAGDLELNAQGLGFWLDAQPRV
jgi:glyoxylase-like metal-dependent hydrolase (beta-lactamase superfamily II)